ncbi:MAG TPA: hypothetical protein ENK61_02555 [Devosia sp.]|nr:hypothetical protein [Devosia sp.]
MQIPVAPASTGKQHEEKYQNIPRDRWGKWRQSLHEKASARIIPDRKTPAQNQQKPQNPGHSGTPALKFSPAPDSEASMLFTAILLRPY